MPLDSNDVAVLIVLVTALVLGDGASPTCSPPSPLLGAAPAVPAAPAAPADDDEEDDNGEEDDITRRDQIDLLLTPLPLPIDKPISL